MEVHEMSDTADPEVKQEDRTAEFLRALFEHVPPGTIEVRILEDRKPGRMLGRRWYPGASELIALIPRMAEYASRNRAGIFFGVLPRRGAGSGKASNTLPGLAAWTDLDFRDFPEGPWECRNQLAAFPLPPTAVVFSGHGLHAYWFMKEPAAPDVLVGLSARLAKALGGDHVADAARILRLPGTPNQKDPEDPQQATVESLDLDRRYDPGDFDAILPPLPEKAEPAVELDVVVNDEISGPARKLIETCPRVRNLFEGRGKPVVDEEGNRLDTTSSGYDYSLVYTLATKGVTDPSALATVLWHRPDDAARSKGMKYVQRTVRNALARVEATKQAKDNGGEGEEGNSTIDFDVERVRIFNSTPRIYELTIGGVPITLSTGEILSRSRFCIRYVDALDRVPKLPSKPGLWDKQVNQWLAQAEHVEQPPEASARMLLREQILQVAEDLPVGESLRDLTQGKALQHDGVVVFKTLTLLKLLKDTHGEVSSHVLCRELRELGFESKTVRIDGKAVRVWHRGPADGGEEPPRPEAGVTENSI
jgi:hypothetical protein